MNVHFNVKASKMPLTKLKNRISAIGSPQLLFSKSKTTTVSAVNLRQRPCTNRNPFMFHELSSISITASVHRDPTVAGIDSNPDRSLSRSTLGPPGCPSGIPGTLRFDPPLHLASPSLRVRHSVRINYADIAAMHFSSSVPHVFPHRDMNLSFCALAVIIRLFHLISEMLKAMLICIPVLMIRDILYFMSLLFNQVSYCLSFRSFSTHHIICVYLLRSHHVFYRICRSIPARVRLGIRTPLISLPCYIYNAFCKDSCTVCAY